MLSDKVWITRKARIFSEQRLNNKAFLSQILMIVYSALLVFLSIWNLFHSNLPLDMLSIFGAIAVLISSVFLISQRYTERALSLRNCYIQLDALYLKVKRAEGTKEMELLAQLESEYFSILTNVENHTDYDYLCLRYSLRNNQETTLPGFRKLDYVSLFWAKLWRFVVLSVYFFLPILVILAWNIFK
jgi:hypothetical protein